MKVEDITNRDDEWRFIFFHYNVMANPNNIRHERSLKALLDFFYDSELSMTENDDLHYLDVFDAWVAVTAAVVSQALNDEYYEIISVLDTSIDVQSKIVSDYIEAVYIDEEDRRFNREHLRTTLSYYRIIKQDLLNNITKK